jgi:tetratricopeptide (TPR) repeat protein
MAEIMASWQPGLLADLGQIDEALSDAARVADQLERAGNAGFTEPRSLQLRLLTERGQHEQAPSPEPMLKAAHDSGQPQLIALVVAAAAPLLHAQGHPEQAHLLLDELYRDAASRTDPVYASLLPGLVRSALALDDPGLATSLTDGVQPLTPLHQHALTTSQAHLTEASGNHTQAASLYAEAAQQWQQFGTVPETAYAHLGQGRCLHNLGNPEAETPLREAAELFSTLDYKPALAETEALLQQAEAAATS